MGISEFALSLIIELLGAAIERGVDLSVLPYFKQRRIRRRVEDAAAEVVEPLIPFLEREHVSEDKQRRLIQTCVEELSPFTNRPELLFQGSLNGQKIFDQLYSNRELPQVIIEDGLKDVYTLLFPRIATLFCKVPAAVKDWENEAWSESFRRLDEMSSQMLRLFGRVDELTSAPLREADETLMLVRRAIAQKIAIEVDLTSLRGDHPISGNFEALFVFPTIEGPLSVMSPSECFKHFTNYGHIEIVVGAAGAGKSTWSKWFQREVLGPLWDGIAVRIELRRFSEESLPSMHELIREAAGIHLAEELNEQCIRRWLGRRQVIFIFDGFDEIPVRLRDDVQAWISDLHLAAPDCSFILTSRPLTTDHLGKFSSNNRRWIITPFDFLHKVDYIKRWYCNMPLLTEGERSVDAGDLASTWSADPMIGHLTGNPLLLSTLLMVHHLDGKLPSSRAQLFRRYVEGMLGIWDARRKVDATSVRISLEEKKQILRGLALKMFLQEVDQLEEKATVEIVESLINSTSIKASTHDSLAILRERSGLLIGPGTYSFIHKSIAEYLVAEAILQGDQRDSHGIRIDRFKLFEHRNDDRWNTVTFLWAGMAPVSDIESFIDTCIDAGSFPPAYGIVLDQYERISLDTKRRIMGEVLKGKNVPPFTGEIELRGYSHPANWPDRLSIPTFALRGITLFAGLDKLLSLLYQDEPQLFIGYTQSHPQLRDLLWLVTVTNIGDVSLWKEFLKEPHPRGGGTSAWTILVADFAVRNAFTTEGSVSLSDIFDGIKSAFPVGYGAVAIAIMTNILELRNHIKPGRVIEALNLLPEIDHDQVSKQFLRETDRWAFKSNHKGLANVVDLMTEFVKYLKSVSDGRTPDEEQVISRAIEYTEQLQQERKGMKR